MSKTLHPSVFATSRLSPPPSKSPHLSASATTLVSKTPFLIDDILHQHQTTTQNYKNTTNLNTCASHLPTSGAHGKSPGSLNNISYSITNNSNAVRNGDGNSKSVIKPNNDLSDCGSGNNKESGRSNEGSLGIFHDAEQLIIRNVEEDYRRHIERYKHSIFKIGVKLRHYFPLTTCFCFNDLKLDFYKNLYFTRRF